MATRVYVLAKQLGVPTKDLVDRLLERGVNIKNNFSGLTDEEEALALSLYPTASPRAERPAPRFVLRDGPTASTSVDGHIASIDEQVAELKSLAAQISRLLARRKERVVARKARAHAEEVARTVFEKPTITAPARPQEAAPERVQAPVEPPAEAPAPAPVEATEVAALAASAPPGAEAVAPAVEAGVEPQPTAEGTAAEEHRTAKIIGPPRTGKTRRVVTMQDRVGGPRPLITRPATPLTRPAPRLTPGRRRPEGDRPFSARPFGGRPSGAFGGGPGQPPGAGGAGGPGSPGALAKGQSRRKAVGSKSKTRFFPGDKPEQDWTAEQALARGLQKHRPGDARTAVRRPEKVDITLPVTVKEFSLVSGLRQSDILKFFLMRKKIVNANSHLSEEMIEELGIHFEIEIEVRKEFDLEAPLRVLEEKALNSELKVRRPPVVTFLGHVDHGKTSLLDYIRKTNVHEREAGGITQHISAYRIDLPAYSITFVDTPGHAAFTNMRARGARATDIVVLVVAADDGPMPTTEEAISHIREADVGVVVALNKCDLPSANPDRAKHRLAELGLIPPEWGGDTEMVQVSAMTGAGIPDLLETIHLMAQVKDLSADQSLDALGVVLEAKSSGGRGILVTALVQHGTLRVGDYVLCGQAHGRIRGLWSTTTGAPVVEAGPSSPVEIMGLPIVPEAGDKFYVLADTQLASSIADERQRRRRELERAETEQVVTLENFLDKLKKTEEKELRIVLKTDVKGSVEAIQKQVIDLGTDEVRVKMLRAGVGMVNEGDVVLAEASKGIIIGFNVTIDERARVLAEERGVQIRNYHVIYELLDDVKAGLEDRLTPIYEEVINGHAEILQVFKASKLGNIAGCMVRDGSIHRIDKARVLRGGEKIHEGELASLQRGKDSAKEVREGFECGLKFVNFEDVREGDVIECFRTVAKRRTL